MTDFAEAADAMAELEEENLLRGEEIAGSYLRRFLCSRCRTVPTLAVPERGPVALCGECRAEVTGYGAPDGSMPYMPVVRHTVQSEQSRYRAVVVREEHPPPERRSTPVEQAGVSVPAPVASLAATARTAGWSVLVQYARGRGIHSRTGAPLKSVVDSFAIRMQQGQKLAVAVQENGIWKSVWILGDRVPYGKAGLTELKEYVRVAGEMGEEWFAAITERRLEQEYGAAVRDACNRGAHGAVEARGTMQVCTLCDHSWERGKQSWRKEKKAREHA